MATTSQKNKPSNLDTWTWDRRFRSIFDSALDAVVTMDVDGRVIDWNERAELCFGFTRQEARGRPLAEMIIPPPFREAFYAGLQRFLQTGESRILNRRVEFTALRKNGEEFPVELSITPVKIAAALIFNAFARDLSEQKAEAERRRRETLEARLLHHAATLSLSDQTFDEALRNCVATICDATGWPVGHVYLPDHASGRLVSSSIWQISDPDRFATLRRATEEAGFTRGVGVPGQIWQSQKPVWIEDVNRDPDFLRLRGAPDLKIKGVFGFPVVYGQEVAAVLEFFHHEVIAPDPALLIMVESVGKQLGDVVARRRGQAERNHLASIVECSNDAIIAKSLDGTILTWNRGAERIYGYTAAEAVGRPVSLVTPADMPDEEPEIRDVVRYGKRLEHFETRRRRKNGELVDVSITVSAIRNSEGRIIGSSTIERDITLKNRRERELQAAKEAAEAANRIKGEFLANISHELRTPMNAILGMLELALGEKLSPVMADYLRTAHESARTLLSLLNDLLDFSRIEAGRFELEPAPFSLRDLLDGTMKMMSIGADEKGLELTYHVGRNVPDRLLGDAKRLKQIVINLVSNAINFTEQGEVVVEVDTESRVESGTKAEGGKPKAEGVNRGSEVGGRRSEVGDQDHSPLTTHHSPLTTLDSRPSTLDSSPPLAAPDAQVELRFDVLDTGIGVSERDRERIFAPFTQADASTTRRHFGTGLGLAICRELVERMNGRLWVESELGKGSRFHFTARLSVLAPDRERAESQGRFADRLRGLRVLAVDDSDASRRHLREMFVNLGLQPTVVSDPSQALEQLRRRRGKDAFQLLLVDAVMPEIDGFTLIEQARRMQVLPEATVLMLSPSDRQTYHDRCDGLHVAGFLEKPVSQSDLLDTVMAARHGPVVELDVFGTAAVADKPLRVLLAEDTVANRKLVTAILMNRGHEVRTASDGREAVELAAAEPFDVVLMDVQMPAMDGFQATAAIRDLEASREARCDRLQPVKRPAEAGHYERAARTPIVAMTAHAMRGDRDRCLSAGMDAYLAKPIDATELLETIERLAARGSREESRDESGESRARIPMATRPLALDSPLSTLDSSPPIDRESVLRRLGGDEQLFADVVRYFREDAPPLLQSLREAVAREDAEQIARSAHSLKGLAANIGAQPLADAAQAVERAGHGRHCDQAQTLLATVDDEFKTSLRELDDAARAAPGCIRSGDTETTTAAE